MTLPPVSVVVPTFDRPNVLKTTARALAAMSYRGDYEVIVVDDGSGKGTRTAIDQVRAECPTFPLQYIKQNNSGAARARNRGAQLAGGEIVVFLDDDMVVEEDHLDLHVSHLADSRHKRAVSGHWEFAPEIKKQLQQSSFGRFRLWLEDWNQNAVAMEPVGEELFRATMLAAFDLGIRRDDFLSLGGFDETFPSAGYEDQDFALRARRAGYEFIYDKKIVVYHLDQRTTIDSFSRRVSQGAFTAAIMARKYPEEFAGNPLIVDNSPIARDDGPRVFLKKIAKHLAGSPPGRACLRMWIAVVEVIAPRSKVMHAAYWKWCGIWIHRGVREGITHAKTAHRRESTDGEQATPTAQRP